MRLFKRLFKKKVDADKKTWNDITLGDLMQIRSINELQMATDDEKNLKVASLVCGIDYDTLTNMPLDDVRQYMDKTEFLLHEPVPNKARRTYVINGRKYKLLKNEMELLTSQYIDFQALHKEGFDKVPGELLSIMMVPEGHAYNDGYDKEQVISDMYDMHVEDALGIVDFFTLRFVRLMAWTRMFFKWKMRINRLTARRKDKEMMRATEIQLNLVMDELNSMFGWIAQGL